MPSEPTNRPAHAADAAALASRQRRPPRHWATALGVVLITAVAACAGAPDHASPPTSEPAISAAATPSTPAPIEGRIVATEPMAAPDGATGHFVTYRSTDVSGAAIESTGWLAVPTTAGPHRIMVFAHGTTGLGDECAPAAQMRPSLFADFLDAGWVVAFPNYQGLGSPGIHHYLVAESAARSLLDLATAAIELDPEAGADTDVALVGFSQGGHAVLATAQRAAALSPDLNVTAVVAAAPAVLLQEWVASPTSADLGYMAMIAVAYTDAFDMDLAMWLSDDAASRADDIANGCLADADTIMGSLGREAFVADAAPDAPIGELLARNEGITTGIEIPLLLVTGGRDRLFSAEVTDRVVADWCALGMSVDHVEFPDAGHPQLSSLVREPALAWLSGHKVGAAACG